MQTKQHQFITSKAFLISSEIKFKHEDYQSLGALFFKAYCEKFNEEPKVILAINSYNDRVKPCSLYPVEFVPIMEEITLNYFSNLTQG